MKNQGKYIAGTNFRHAVLTAQDFRNVTAGLRLRQKFLTSVLSGVGVIASGAMPVLSGSVLEFNSLAKSPIPALISLFAYVICLAAVARYGFQLVSISFTLGILVPASIAFFVATPESKLEVVTSTTIVTILSIVLSYLSILIISFLLILHASVVGRRRSLLAFAGLIAFSLFAIHFATGERIRGSFSGGNIAVAAVLFTILTVAFVVLELAKNSSKLAWIHDRALFWAATGGTSFYAADLTDACFDNANLRHTDFRKANLTRTRFKNATGLRLARLEGTILEELRVRGLVVSGNGCGQDLTDVDLQGANLQEADLREAVLVGAKLLDADLSGANLTDACIQDWNINHNTRFIGVECKRVYLKRSPSGHFLEPKPDSGEFLPGEFEKWVTDIRDTIDLIFQNGLNWRAFAFSLTQTAIDHEGLDLSVRSIENKGDGVVVAKVGVSLETNKTAIHREMSGHYQGAVVAIEAGYDLALRAKDEEIDRLTDFYTAQQKFIQGLVTSISETKAPVVIQGEGNRVYLMDQAGDIMENSSQNINAGGNADLSSGARVSIGGDMTGSTVNLGNLSGQVSNTIQQLHDIQTGEGEELAKILATLQDAIEGDRSLTSDQKQQALEAVSTLAEEGSKPPEQRTAKFCTMAVNALKGLASSLTDASKLAEAAKLLLPTLGGIFGV